VPGSAVLQAVGLQTSPNALSTAPGSLTVASNVIIQRNAVVQSRRGFDLYGTPLPTGDARVDQLMAYKGRIMRHYSNMLDFDTATTTPGTTNLPGEEIFDPFITQLTAIGTITLHGQIITNVPGTTGIRIGMTVTGPGIPSNTLVTDLTLSTVTINKPSTSAETGVTFTFTGPTYLTEVIPGHRIRSQEANGNFYMATAQGTQKISATNASELTSTPNFIQPAGALQAVGIEANLVVNPGEITGFLPQDSVVAYRSVWAYNDNNLNLLQGVPSQPAVVYNSLQNLLVQDFMRLLVALDDVTQNPMGGSLANYGYVQALALPYNASSEAILANLILLAQRLDVGMFSALPSISSLTWASSSITTLIFSSATTLVNGDYITLSGVTPTAYNGTYQIGGVTTTTNANDTITFTITNNPGTWDTGTGTASQSEYRGITQPASIVEPVNDQQLVALQTYLQTIIETLQAEPFSHIATANLAEYISILNITTSAEVQVIVDIPRGITPAYFMQLYRGDISQALQDTALDTLAPDDEMQQVYEKYPTAQDIANGYIVVNDNTPDSFKGANLYTNPSTGVGILQANAIPPIALDIALFKQVMFYANTTSAYQLLLNMLGTTALLAGNIINISASNPAVITTDAPHGLATGAIVYINDTMTTPALSGLYPVTVLTTTTFSIPVHVTSGSTQGYWTNSMVSISSSISSNTYKFIKGMSQVSSVTTTADSSNSLNGTYFLLYSAANLGFYYVWFKTTGGAVNDPMVANAVGIRVDILTNATADEVAEQLSDAILAQVQNFTSSYIGDVVTITCTGQGVTTATADGTTGFAFSTTAIGRGENLATQEVLLSTNLSPATALEDTSKSFLRCVNYNPLEVCNGFYLSAVDQIPGMMQLAGRQLDYPQFFVMGSSYQMGISFSPNIAPASLLTITNSATNPTVITTPTPHGLESANEVVFGFSNSTPPIANPQIITYISATTFSVPIDVTTAGTTGLYELQANAVAATNNVYPNYLYYSSLQEPEAVPIVNFIPVGAQDQPILRIFPLRNSLFIFKTDGLFRISGDTAPFYLELFDESTIINAWDSLDMANNQLYVWTLQGIQIVSESGVPQPPISRPIDQDILTLASNTYPNFQSLTWGIAYNSDNSYTVFTNSTPEDTSATIGYRYSTLTQSWTTVDQEVTCGVINQANDLLYLGAGDTNYIEQERKSFTRLDHADREVSTTLIQGNYFADGATIQLPNITNINAGDVLVQVQTISVSQFNALLSKLDLDLGVGVIDIESIGLGATPLVTTAASSKGSPGHNLSVGDYVSLTGTNSYPVIDGTYEVLTVPSNVTFTVAVSSAVTTAGTVAGFVKRLYALSQPAQGGDNIRIDLVNLANKLDTDPSTVLTNYYTLIEDRTGTITAISAVNPTIITSTAHGLVDQRIITITGSNSTPSIDSTWQETLIDANNFSIPISVLVAGTAGTFATVSSDFRDQLACFNAIIANLNIDSGLFFDNYLPISTTTTLETSILTVNIFTNQITLALPLEFVQGGMTVYNAIDCLIQYAPQTLGDPLGLKHMREATVMFQSKAFSAASLNFASDLQPQFIAEPFTGDGPGLFGLSTFGQGYFGGASNSSPFRTYVPRNCQRCRYLLVQFQHQVAREIFSIYGITLTGEVGQSSRAYR
jgi:hypothetical protein